MLIKDLFDRPEIFKVIAGTNDIDIKWSKDNRNVYEVKEIIVHPGYVYQNGTVLHDIGIMVLKSPISMTNGVTEPAKLAQKDLPISNKIEM